MKRFSPIAATLLATFSVVCGAVLDASADVKIEQLDDRFRIEVDGELFTEWQLKAWSVPYLYPVIGPNGENLTRHYPMRDDVEGESQDHPHHRSIRFSHRRVNGMSFWSPDSKQGGYETSIELEKVEKMESGKTGELILWNKWIGDGEVLLRERVSFRFQPLPDRQMLMDFDVELYAGEEDVTFQDEKDGGLGIRVAATMKVEDRKTKQGAGTIVNSKGQKNAEAWGKRAKWCDYYGPDASGKTVGVAIFDHPSNLRFPTHWHARTYGLLTANRFGKGYFEKAQGATKGEGDYTIKAGESIKLRHRFYIHHGDAEAAGVEAMYGDYRNGK